MPRSLFSMCLFAFILFLMSAAYAEPLELEIVVSPGTIAVESDGEWVSVHTDIALSAVDTASLKLNGLPVSWTKADARGNLVAKFDANQVKAIVTPDETALTLTGLTTDRTPFSGTDTVRVKGADPLH
jgi:hypothetical protein